MRSLSMKIKPIIIFLFCFLILSVPVFAERVVDNAGILSDLEAENLRKLADSLAEKYNFDLVIVTERSIDYISPEDYARDFFYDNGYGLGNYNEDGCIFLRVTGTRDYYFQSFGRGIKILNETAFDKLVKDATNHLGYNRTGEAFKSFLYNWEEFLKLEAKGRNYNFFHQWHFASLAVVWLISIFLGYSFIRYWKKQMNTVLGQTHASAYMILNSLKFTEKKDRFLYSTTTKTRRQSQGSGSRGGISGGISGGRSSGGRSGRR